MLSKMRYLLLFVVKDNTWDQPLIPGYGPKKNEYETSVTLRSPDCTSSVSDLQYTFQNKCMLIYVEASVGI